MRPVYGAVVQVQQAGAAKLGQQGGVRARPPARLGPVPQPTPGRHAGTAHGLCGDIAPRDTGPQLTHDAGERHSVGNTQPSRVAMAPFGERRDADTPGSPRKPSESPQAAPVVAAGR